MAYLLIRFLCSVDAARSARFKIVLEDAPILAGSVYHIPIVRISKVEHCEFFRRSSTEKWWSGVLQVSG